MIGRLADAFQIAWSLFYWNLRKTWFRLQRGRAPCPCQTPSDSGRAMETGCEPSLSLTKPARFRHVCPLLKPDANGSWKCSVDTPQVRPFWGRASLIFLSGLLIVYAFLTAGAWALLRYRGYEISYAQIAWPGRWPEFHHAQSLFFAEKANRSLARHDVGEAMMSLSIAYQLDPQNYRVGFLFAQLAQGTQPALADQVYGQLVRDHPGRRPETFSAWYQSLLWRADFRGIVSLSRDALQADPDHANAWLNTMILALRREPDPALERELAAQTGAAAVHDVFTLDLQTLGSPENARRALLKPPSTDATAFFNYYIPRRLLEIGAAKSAFDLLTSRQLRLSPRDRMGLLLDAYAALGWQSLLSQQITQLINQPMNEATVEVLSAYFIRHPDHELLALSFDAFAHQPASAPEVAYREWVSWLFAAGANGDLDRFQQAADKMKAISNSDFRALPVLKQFFLENSAQSRIESFLPAVQPLPIDVTYALLDRYYRPRNKPMASP